MNRVVLIGRLTRDPDVRYSNSQEPMCIARYSLAIDRPGKDKGADFPMCTCLGKTGEFAEKYLRQGMKIAVTGRIQTGSYTNKDGAKVYTTEVLVDSHEFCESKGAAGQAPPEQRPEGDGFMNIPDGFDEELPFN